MISSQLRRLVPVTNFFLPKKKKKTIERFFLQRRSLLFCACNGINRWPYIHTYIEDYIALPKRSWSQQVQNKKEATHKQKFIVHSDFHSDASRFCAQLCMQVSKSKNSIHCLPGSCCPPLKTRHIGNRGKRGDLN